MSTKAKQYRVRILAPELGGRFTVEQYAATPSEAMRLAEERLNESYRAEGYPEVVAVSARRP